MEKYSNNTKDYLQMYNVSDIMRIFCCGRDKAYAIMQLSGFPSIKMGNIYLVEHKSLEKWIRSHEGKSVII